VDGERRQEGQGTSSRVTVTAGNERDPEATDRKAAKKMVHHRRRI
jgi:hypothetical protein